MGIAPWLGVSGVAAGWAAAAAGAAGPAVVRREVVVSRRYLLFPVRTGAATCHVTVRVGDRVERFFDIELVERDPEWWAFLDVGAWAGRTLTLEAGSLPAGSAALAAVEPSDTVRGGDDLYREPLRPQFHFTSRRGWNNDPNGLVYAGGEYHLFYQHNPYGWSWGNMHWGHAVSRDLVHWQELDDALAPDALGPMFSGSAVVDWRNTSGLGSAERPPVVLVYTAAGRPTVQCIASATDGRQFAKFAGNPVVRQISDGNRDPKVVWHEPSRAWVMALYVGYPDPANPDAHGKPGRRDTIHFLRSPNLREWTVAGQVDGFFECPDLFELPVAGDPAARKWVLTAASSEYQVGTFDGHTFTPETPRLPGHRGRGFYAAQTFSDIPAADGRRIQIGWLQAATPGMPFNQAMSLPLALSLRTTADGPRLVWEPVRELELLRAASHRFGPCELRPGAANPLAGVAGELLEMRAEFAAAGAQAVSFTVRGVPIVYEVDGQALVVNGQRAPAPLRDGRQRLIVYADRTSVEVFASDGLTYVPMPVIARPDLRSVELSVQGGPARFAMLDVHELRSAWH